MTDLDMQRSEAMALINEAILKKYKRATLSSICESEGWQVPEISRALNPKETATIPKKLLDFAGLEVIKEPVYRKKAAKKRAKK